MIPSLISEKLVTFWHSYLNANSSVLVAVSGGSDSVGLIYLLHELREMLKISKLGVAHVNHGLRGAESDGDEVLVREAAAKLNIPLFTERLGGKSLHDTGVEEWARQERYRFFNSVKESGGFDYIATGHTADDQAETVLFRMLRGAGVKGLRGILPVREDGVIRPLLFIKKQQIVDYLNAEQIPFRVDSSNADTSLSRNFIRHELLNVINRYEAGAVERLNQLAVQMQSTWEIVAAEANKWVESFVMRVSDKSFVVKKSGLQNNEVASEGLKLIFEEYGIPCSREHLEGVFVQGQRSGGFFLLPGKWHYQPARERIFFTAETVQKEEFLCILPIPGTNECKKRNIGFVITEDEFCNDSIENDQWSAFLDRASIKGETLVYRKIRLEDEFVPFGRNDSTGLLRFLAKQGISKDSRENIGVVADGSDNVVWVPGVRLNQSCAVKKTTQRVIKIVSRTLSNSI